MLAIREDIPFIPEDATDIPNAEVLGGTFVLPTYAVAVEEINRWLVGIPRNKRTFDTQPFTIIQRK